MINNRNGTFTLKHESRYACAICNKDLLVTTNAVFSVIVILLRDIIDLIMLYHINLFMDTLNL